MALREILTDKDPVLKKTSKPVTNFDGRLHDLLDDLKETLANAGGAGLAAPQIGILRRCVIVVDANGEMLELVNPEIIWKDAEPQEGFEGCLSVPGMWGVVTRPMRVRVRAQDRSGKTFEAEGEEIVARCFCHELDHLDGHLFTEYTDHLYTQEELDAILDAQEDGELETGESEKPRRSGSAARRVQRRRRKR